MPARLRPALALPAILLAGCAWLQVRALTPIPADREHVVLQSPAPVATVGGVRYTGPLQNQDYLLLRGPDSQAELIYIGTIGFQTSIEYRGTRLRQFTEGWAINSGGIRAWSKPHTLDTPLAQFRYVRYSTREPARECAAFQALWDVPGGDVQHRPGKLIFGYDCANAGAALTDAGVRQFLSALRIGFYPSASRPPPVPLRHAAPSGTASGYRPFPLLLPIFHPPTNDHQIDGLFPMRWMNAATTVIAACAAPACAGARRRGASRNRHRLM